MESRDLPGNPDSTAGTSLLKGLRCVPWEHSPPKLLPVQAQAPQAVLHGASETVCLHMLC